MSKSHVTSSPTLADVLSKLIKKEISQVEATGLNCYKFLINIIGSFLIGIIAALAAKNAVNPKLVTFIKVGICGGFTTFSSFALETDQLMSKGQSIMAVCYAVLSIILGVAAVFVAQKLILGLR